MHCVFQDLALGRMQCYRKSGMELHFLWWPVAVAFRVTWWQDRSKMVEKRSSALCDHGGPVRAKALHV